MRDVSEQLSRVQESLQAACRVATLDVDAPLMEAGMNSLQAVLVMRACSDALGVTLPATLPFEHPTARRLAAAIAEPPRWRTAMKLLSGSSMGLSAPQ